MALVTVTANTTWQCKGSCNPLRRKGLAGSRGGPAVVSPLLTSTYDDWNISIPFLSFPSIMPILMYNE